MKSVRVGTAVCAMVAGSLVAIAPSPATAAPACRAGGPALGVLGALSGPNRQFGIAASRGVALAIARHNAAYPACKVRLVQSDSQGDPNRASAAAAKLLNEPAVLGVVGPTFSGETLATGRAFSRAGLVTITPSATNPAITTHGWRTFFRASANDNVIAAAAGRFLTGKLKRRHVCVVRDGSDFGALTAKAIGKQLGNRRACSIKLSYARPNYKKAAKTVRSKGADAVFFAGYDLQAAPMVRALRKAGFKGKFVGGDGTNSSLFAKRSGKAGRGAYVVAGPAPRTVSKSLAARYRKIYGAAMPTYVAEAYDAASIELAAIARGATTRAAVLGYVRGQRTKGITHTFRFTRTGELRAPNAWAYVVRKGKLAAPRRVR